MAIILYGNSTCKELQLVDYTSCSCRQLQDKHTPEGFEKRESGSACSKGSRKHIVVAVRTRIQPTWDYLDHKPPNKNSNRFCAVSELAAVACLLVSLLDSLVGNQPLCVVDIFYLHLSLVLRPSLPNSHIDIGATMLPRTKSSQLQILSPALNNP